jgi:hypothetical protein
MLAAHANHFQLLCAKTEAVMATGIFPHGPKIHCENTAHGAGFRAPRFFILLAGTSSAQTEPV